MLMQDIHYMHEVTADIKTDFKFKKKEHRVNGMQFLGLHVQKPHP